MKKWLVQNHTKYALASIACPLLTIFFVFLYVTIAYWNFWKEKYDPDDAPAVGLMIAGVILLLYACTGVANFIGFALAIISIKKQKKLWGAGTIALLLNGLPLAFLIFFFGRGWLRGRY